MFGERPVIEILLSIMCQRNLRGQCRKCKNCRTYLNWRSMLLLMLITTLVYAQAPDTMWTKAYGYGPNAYEAGFSVDQTFDEGYFIVAGKVLDPPGGYEDIWLLRTDANGDTLWSQEYGTWAKSDLAYDGQQTGDSGYVVVGATNAYSSNEEDYQLWLLKTYANGDTTWTARMGIDSMSYVGRSVQQTVDGGYIIAGKRRDYWGDEDLILAKTDASGNFTWCKIYGGDSTDGAHSVQQTSDAGYIVVGTTRSFGAGFYDVWLLKTDAIGDTIWSKVYGDYDYDCGRSVQQTPDGGYIIAGWRTTFPSNHQDIWLLKTDSDGDTLWTRTYGGQWGDFGFAVDNTSDSCYIVAGRILSTPGDGDFYFVKTDANGDTVWTKTLGGPDYESPDDIMQTTDEGYIVVGYTESFGAGGPDVWLVKTEPDLGIEDNLLASVDYNAIGATIISGSLRLPTNKSCKVFDITGRVVDPTMMKCGIYFLEIDKKIVQKVVKVK